MWEKWFEAKITARLQINIKCLNKPYCWCASDTNVTTHCATDIRKQLQLFMVNFSQRNQFSATVVDVPNALVIVVSINFPSCILLYRKAKWLWSLASSIYATDGLTNFGTAEYSFSIYIYKYKQTWQMRNNVIKFILRIWEYFSVPTKYNCQFQDLWWQTCLRRNTIRNVLACGIPIWKRTNTQFIFVVLA